MFRWSQRILGKSKLVEKSCMDPNISFLLGSSDQKRYPQPTLFLYHWEYRANEFHSTKKGKERKEVSQDG